MKIPLQLAALALTLSMGLTPIVSAQTTSYNNRPIATVETFGVTQLKKLSPGSELFFTLNGTPGASVRLRKPSAGPWPAWGRTGLPCRQSPDRAQH